MLWCCCQGEPQYVESIWVRPWFSSQATAGIVFPASSDPSRESAYPLGPPPVGFGQGTSIEARAGVGSPAIPAATDIRLTFRGYDTEPPTGSTLTLKAYVYDAGVALPTMSPVVPWTVPRNWLDNPGSAQTSPNLTASVAWLIANGHVAPLPANRKFCFLFTTDTNLIVVIPSPPWFAYTHWVSELNLVVA